MSTEEKPPGTRLFDAQIELMGAEDAVERLLEGALGGLDEIDTFSADYYDASIEVYLPPGRDADVAAARLLPVLIGTGVQSIYVHAHEKDARPKDCLATCKRRVVPR